MSDRVKILILINEVSVREIVARRNLSHEQVAKQLRMTPRYWSKLLTGYRRPSAGMRDRIIKTKAFRGVAWEKVFRFDKEISHV